MTIYDFVVSFVGDLPSEFTFIYSILTLIISLVIIGTFSSLIYFPLKFFRRNF